MIITAQKLLCTHKHGPPLDRGAIVINRGSILAAGHADAILKKYPGHSIVRLANVALMPGLINSHTHLELPPLLDTIRSRTFSQWVLNLIKAKQKLDSSDYSITTQRNIRSLIMQGTTTVGEICTHDASPAFLKQSGLRAVIYKEIIVMDPLQDITSRLASFLSRPSSLIRYGLSPHTPYTVSEHALHEIKTFSRQKGIPLSMHVAESRDELRMLQRKKSGLSELYRMAGWSIDWAPSGSSSFEYLHRIGLLSPLLLAVHAVHITDKDIAAIKRSGVSIAHCPRSNSEINAGKMPLKKLLYAGIPVGLGTDSLASSPSLNMWDEMRYAHKVHCRDGITPQDIFMVATIGGARALGLSADVGSIEPGQRADLIAVSLPEKDSGDIYSDLLRETKSCIMTMVNGKVLHKQT